MSVLFGFALAEFKRSRTRPPDDLAAYLYPKGNTGTVVTLDRKHKLEPGGAMEPREDAEIEMEERIAIAKERGEDIP